MALPADLTFVDYLQRRFSHQVGYLPLVALRNRIEKGCIWIAFEHGQPAGYIHGVCPYLRRPNLAIIYQAAIDYDVRHRAIGTALVEQWATTTAANAAQLVLWCAQDIEANLFWEAIGFSALAWRAGSVRKGRIHLYWSRIQSLAPAHYVQHVPAGTKDGLLHAKRVVKLFEPGAPWSDRPSVSWSSLEVARVSVVPDSPPRLLLPPSPLRPSPSPVPSSPSPPIPSVPPLLPPGPRLTRIVVGGRFKLIEIPPPAKLLLPST